MSHQRRVLQVDSISPTWSSRWAYRDRLDAAPALPAPIASRESSSSAIPACPTWQPKVQTVPLIALLHISSSCQHSRSPKPARHTLLLPSSTHATGCERARAHHSAPFAAIPPAAAWPGSHRWACWAMGGSSTKDRVRSAGKKTCWISEGVSEGGACGIGG